MGNAEFLLLLSSNPWLFAGCLLGALLLYFLIFRKVWVSILDPISLTWIASAVGFAVVWFLYLTDEILPIYLWSYLTSQAAFLVGFFVSFRSKFCITIPRRWSLHNEEVVGKYIFVGATMVDIVAQLAQYALVGIPLFMDSRLDVMKDGGGAGLLMRMFETARTFTVIMLLYYLMKGKSTALFRHYAFFYLVYLLGVFILSGSRGAILVYGSAFFMFAVSYRNQYPKMMDLLRRYEWKVIGVASVFVVLLMGLKGSGALDGLLGFIFRIVAYGDPYWYAYPNELIEQVDDSSPFLSLFSSFFGSFRIIPYEDLPRPIGMELFAQLSSVDVVGGPNARHNIFGYLYFGIFGGAVFSFICGTIIGSARKVFLANTGKSILSVTVLAWFYVVAGFIETDPNFFFFSINSFIMMAPFVLSVGGIGYVWSRYLLRK